MIVVRKEVDNRGNQDLPRVPWCRRCEITTCSRIRLLMDGSFEAIRFLPCWPTQQIATATLCSAMQSRRWRSNAVDLCDDTRGRIDIAEPDVVEGVAPILADVDGDGAIEVVVTLSNSDGGARLAAYELNGSLVAESAPIGRGNRWRNQLAVGPFGPGGKTEIVDVRTPHLGGIVQAFQLRNSGDGVTLERVAASAGEFTSHPLGSRNVDMGVALDANADSALDVLVAAFSRDRLIALTRTDRDGGWREVATVDLPGQLASNIAI